jgi:predicted metal-binding membrane protein
MALFAVVKPADRRDTPRSAMSRLEMRVTLATVGVLLGLAGVAWAATVRQALDMSTMVTGLGQVGTHMRNDMGALLFMGMWLTMMVAMMFPTIGPIVLAHRLVVRQRGEGVMSSAAFVLGYLVVWSVIGLGPLTALLSFRYLSGDVTNSRWLLVVSSLVLVGAGLYQFTPIKNVCLKACHTPLGFILTHDFRGGAPGAFRTGVSHGAYCLGCCWALMAVLVVMGLMNLVWMATLAMIFLLEKNWRHGLVLSRIVGASLVLLGLVVMLYPGLLVHLSNGWPYS